MRGTTLITDFARIDVSSGMIDISDPSYEDGEGRSIRNLKVKPGEYVAGNCVFRVIGSREKYVVKLILTHFDFMDGLYLGDQQNWEKIGVCTVDCGSMAICESSMPDMDEPMWIKFCTKIEGPVKRLGTVAKVGKKPIVVCEACFGDGCYDVYAAKKDGEIVAVEVRFAETTKA